MKRSYELQQQLQTGILLSPWLLTFVLFWLYPLVYSLYLSGTKYMTISNSVQWVGLKNYIGIFHDEAFFLALKNTCIFVLGTIPLTTAFALFLAVLLDETLNGNVRFRTFFRSAFFLPSVTSLVVISLVFTNLFARDGALNGLLQMVNLPFPVRGWLLEPQTAMPAIMGMEIWIAAGYYMVLFLAAMQAIPKDLYEAAELAGATKSQQIFRITLPLLRPTLLFVLVINTIKSFQVFVEIYVMTKGGPLGATSTLIYYVYEHAFERADSMGYASALAYVVFAIIAVLSALQLRFFSGTSSSKK